MIFVEFVIKYPTAVKVVGKSIPLPFVEGKSNPAESEATRFTFFPVFLTMSNLTT